MFVFVKRKNNYYSTLVQRSVTVCERKGISTGLCTTAVVMTLLHFFLFLGLFCFHLMSNLLVINVNKIGWNVS